MKFLLPAFSVLVLSASLVACGGGDEGKKPPVAGTGGSSGTGGDGAGGMGGEGAGGGMGVCEGVECPGDLSCEDQAGDAACVCLDEPCDAPTDCSEDPCDDNAECIPLSDGFRCECNEGYSGNGVVCVEGDLCEDVVCTGANTQCRVIGLAGVCQCKTGYEAGAGPDCVDIDECSLGMHDCDQFGTCVNFNGGHRCDCPPGFDQSSSGACSDLDECVLGIDNCDASDGICMNNTGSFQCSCDGETVGDGTFCKASADCDTGTCENGGECVETETGFRCECPIGTTGSDCSDTTACDFTVVLNEEGNPLIEDEALMSAIHAAVGIPFGEEVTVSDLVGLTSLTAPPGVGSNPVITSLEGLQCWPSLEVLTLPDHAITDLSPLANLNQLALVDVSCNPLTDVSVLAGHPNLETFVAVQGAFCQNQAQIGDTSAFGEMLNLRELQLVGHGIVGLDFLTTAVRLEILELSDNDISSTLPLSGLNELSEVRLGGNAITSLAALAGLPKLRVLGAVQNDLSDISSLSASSSLYELDLSNNSISDVAALNELEQLRVLRLSNNTISQAAPLAALINLTVFDIAGNEVATLEPFVDSPEFGYQGQMYIAGNPLPCSTEAAFIAELESRGLSILGSCQ